MNAIQILERQQELAKQRGKFFVLKYADQFSVTAAVFNKVLRLSNSAVMNEQGEVVVTVGRFTLTEKFGGYAVVRVARAE